jgi:hypothetical protein
MELADEIPLNYAGAAVDFWDFLRLPQFQHEQFSMIRGVRVPLSA